MENHDAGLIDWYLAVLEDKKEKFLTASGRIVADAYFSKKNFADGLSNMGFHLISHFRDDAVLFYLTTQAPTGQKGRPKRFDGKIDLKNLDMTIFEKISLTADNGNLYTEVVYAKSVKRLVKLVAWFSKDRKKHKPYFSTDKNISETDLIDTYRARFQIEFNFRDAKPFTGLNQCQARNLTKLKFNFNASLTAVNIAKVLAIERGMRFPMASIKTMMHNMFMVKRFISVSGIKPDKRLNELIAFATIAT